MNVLQLAPPLTVEERTQPKVHLPGVDVVRMLAVLGVVWVHTGYQPSMALVLFAVPAFVSLAALLATAGGMRRSTRGVVDYAADRVRRLYVPFLCWSAIYMGVDWLLGFPVQPLFRPGFLVRGGEYHLWFLPYVLVVSVAAFAAGRYLSKSSERTQGVFIGICALIAVAVLLYYPPRHDSGPFYAGLTRWGANVPWMLLGIAAGWLAVKGKLGHAKGFALIAGVVFMVTETASLSESTTSIFAIGALILLCLVCPGIGRSQAFQRVAQMAYGIYLVHVLFILLLQRVSPGIAVDATLWAGIARSAAVLSASVLLVWVLQLSRFTRWLVV